MHQNGRGRYQQVASIAIAAICGLATLSHAQQARRDGRGIDQQPPIKQIRTNVISRDVFEQIMKAGMNPAACRPGLGVSDYYVTPEQEALLQQMEQPYEVIDADVRARHKAEQQRIAQHNEQLAAGLRGVSWYDDYKDRDQVNTLIDDLVAAHPTLVSKIDIGDSLESRETFAMRISGDGTTKPAVLINACQHAREWLTPMTAMYIAEQLLTNYSSDPWIQQLVDSTEIFIVPITNPDGYVYTWTTDRNWRKNRRDNGGGIFGVDPNRNWDKNWGGVGSSGSTDSQIYRGTAPFSEPETQNLRDFILARPQIVAHIDFHTFGEVILQPWGFVEPYDDVPNDFESIEALGKMMRDAIASVFGTPYENVSGAGGVGFASGIAPDWTTDQGIIGYTIEMRPACCTFDPDPTEIEPNAQENYQAALAMIDFARTLPVDWDGDSVPPPVLPANSTVNIDFTFEPRGGLTLDPTTGKLFTQTAARSWIESPLTHMGGDDYQATFNTGPCGEVIEWYLQIDTTDGYAFTVPADGADSPHAIVATTTVTIADDSFETDAGWTTSATASDGQWQRGVPIDDDSWPYDPVSDGDGSGQAWLTDNTAGNSDVDGGSVTLTSPAYDMTVSETWFIFYRYFLHLTDLSVTDRMTVEISSGGLAGPWTQIALHDSSGALLWREHIITQDDLDAAGVTLTDDMRLRFIASDLDSGQIVEAGIDDLDITGIEVCSLPGDTTGDGNVDLADLLDVLSNWGTGGSGGGDADGDGDVDLADLLAVLSNWGSMA